MLGIIAMHFDQIRNFLRNHPRLARAGTGQHQTRAVHIVHCIALGLVETVGHGNKAGVHPKKLAGAIVTLIVDQSGIGIIAK